MLMNKLTFTLNKKQRERLKGKKEIKRDITIRIKWVVIICAIIIAEILKKKDNLDLIILTSLVNRHSNNLVLSLIIKVLQDSRMNTPKKYD
jgi:hypothetical protein